MTSINTWFVSDTHFGHSTILYHHPPRRDVVGITLDELQEDNKSAIKKHDEWLIDLWNSTVKKKDNIYILGDVSWMNKENSRKLMEKLNGTKFLIRGNHDAPMRGLENYFVFAGDIKEAKFTCNQYDFIDPNETFCVEMCHFPLLTWNRRPHGTCCAHGHSHGGIDDFNTKSGELRVDVGLDGKLADYQFVSLEKLYKHFTDIRDAAGCKTFLEYNEYLMDKQGFRM